MSTVSGSELAEFVGSIVRRAALADLYGVNALVGRAVMTWDLPERVKRLALPSYRYRAEDLEHQEVLLAEDHGGDLLGVAALEPASERDCPNGLRGLLLHGLYVDPEHHGQGVGSHLLAAAAAAARAASYDGLLVKAQADAEGFFRASGLECLAVEDPSRDYAGRFWLNLSTGPGVPHEDAVPAPETQTNPEVGQAWRS